MDDRSTRVRGRTSAGAATSGCRVRGVGPARTQSGGGREWMERACRSHLRNYLIVRRGVAPARRAAVPPRGLDVLERLRAVAEEGERVAATPHRGRPSERRTGGPRRAPQSAASASRPMHAPQRLPRRAAHALRPRALASSAPKRERGPRARPSVAVATAAHTPTAPRHDSSRPMLQSDAGVQRGAARRAYAMRAGARRGPEGEQERGGERARESEGERARSLLPDPREELAIPSL